MAKIHCCNGARAFPVKIETVGFTPIRQPLPVVVQFPAPQAIDELEIPDAPLSILLDRDEALNLAIALYRAAMAQKDS